MRPDSVLLTAGLLFLAGCGSEDAAPSSSRSGASSRDEAVLRVVVRSPAPADEVASVILPGTLDAWEVAPLYARVTGYVRSVSVDIGDEVRVNAELARLVVPEMQAELRRAEARVAQERAELDLARVTKTRLSALRQSNAEAIPQQDVDVAAAKEQIEAAEVSVARAELDRLRALAGFARLTAPFDGRITRRILDPGALAREGSTSGAEPIVEIARTDRLRLAFDVPEPLSPRVRAGLPVTVRFDAVPGFERDATVSRVSGALDERTRSMRAEIDLENDEGTFRPGMYAAVDLRVEPPAGALEVPSRAIRGASGERHCLVVEDGVLHRREVTVASDDGRRAMIVRGLDASDLVMIAGSPLAREGSRVEPVEESAP